ncbi:hypothetical protein ACTJ5V_02040 [Streptococcus suis]|uniref:hypothetical protein n=1 Tax=Streptococcus suis TaxID=1307 RepID=UPI0003FF4584|nr:hypothetical protein [Streptococcus suis]HEL1811817.1 hypothetical protein [Streptococcus suis]HEM5077915.1 hypothetical protein [Streptococcus suis]HEM5102968.1 hypothetical protein [Streptococcus suis]HEM5109578.1 hypothetical protein [Streptococcus suis]HEM5127414.1 hypothetical protein [Streptococcus suis]
MDWELISNIGQTFTGIAALVLSILAMWKTKKDNTHMILFEKKVELYGELAYYLEKIYNDHELIFEYYDIIRGLYAKGFLIASKTVAEKLQEFVDAMDEEIEVIQNCRKIGKPRSTNYGSFDQLNDTLVTVMELEIRKSQKISNSRIKKVHDEFTNNLGKDFINGGNQ